MYSDEVMEVRESETVITVVTAITAITFFESTTCSELQCSSRCDANDILSSTPIMTADTTNVR